MHCNIELKITEHLEPYYAAQANTAHSWKLKCPQIQNWLTLREVGLCAMRRLTLHEVKQIFFDIRKSPFPGNFGFHSKIQNWLTLCGVGLRAG